MITVTVEGQQRTVSRGKVEMPRTGRWLADLVTDGETIPTGRATITLSSVDMPGKILTGELVNGMLHLRVVAGAGGLGKMARPKHYKAPTVRHVLLDLLADAGEQLSGASSTDVINVSLPHWTTLQAPTGALIQALCDVIGDGCNWRVLFDGTLWLGRETWPACPADARIISQSSFNASAEVGTSTMGIWPGTTLEGRQIDHVVHHLDGQTPRSSVYFVRSK